MNNNMMEIKSLISNFKEEFNKRNLESLDCFVKGYFVDENDTSFVGSGINDWYFGLDSIKKIIRTYWTDKSRYLDDIEIDIDNSVITIEGNTAVVAVSGKSSRNIEEYNLYDQLVDNFKSTLGKDNVKKEELMKLSYKIARAFYETNIGKQYIWPIRMTYFLIKKDTKWMIKHMHFSFGANNGWEYRKIDENTYKDARVIKVKEGCDSETKKIYKLLKKVQVGYNNRDLSTLEDFANCVFANNNSTFIFGTDEGENFYGEKAGYELCKGDWTYWGDFDINADNAYISTCGNMALVYSKAILKYKLQMQGTYDSLGDLFHNYLVPDKIPSKDLLLKMLWKTTKRMYDAELGEEYIVPMKFTGVLIKVNDEWKFQHMHFSDNIDDMPEERII
jgi:hypothetical protein